MGVSSPRHPSAKGSGKDHFLPDGWSSMAVLINDWFHIRSDCRIHSSGLYVGCPIFWIQM